MRVFQNVNPNRLQPQHFCPAKVFGPQTQMDSNENNAKIEGACANPTAARCGFVAIIGAPNAGKSTLVNALVGAKVSIVSRKVQTTRAPVRGIAIHNNAQLIFIDTPGIFAPRRRLDKAMVSAAWTGSSDADVTALIVDASKGLDEEVEKILDGLINHSGPKRLILNKVDRLSRKEELLALSAAISAHVTFDRIYMISALNADGIEDIKNDLCECVPEGPWHYPEDEISDVPMRFLAAEITREKIYTNLHQELPYAATVETTDWKKLNKGAVRIEQTIFVERDSQKSIVLGKGGRTIKQISTQSRAELTDILGHPVHLFLFVKVRENWQDDPLRYKQMGLEWPKD